MSEHTPGPWEIRDSFIGTIVGRVDGLGIAILGNNGSKANARLIKAAPNMLEALERIVRAKDVVKCKTIARAAIAKAKGDK